MLIEEPAPSRPDAALPLIVLLHAFGLSGRSFTGVVEALGDGFDTLTPDLPGFGADARAGDVTLEQTVERVAALVREAQPDRWVVVGHSMGGKVATLLTAQAEAGGLGLIAPDAVVLIDASPPSPEPMSEDRRRSMERWSRDDRLSPAHAAEFVDANAPHPVSAAVRDEAVEDAQRTSRLAWLQWLERGSLEDWSDAVGVLRTPALLVTTPGGDLGTEAQQRLNGPHYRASSLHEIEGAGHFVVLERPGAIAQQIAEQWARVSGPRVLPAAFARLIASDRVSARTRAVMLARLDGPGDAPRALSGAQREVLTALLARVLPQRGTDLDLAGRIDAELAAGHGDGWRFADLPPDADAWRAGLDTVARSADGFTALAPAQQDGWIARFASGDAGLEGEGLLDGARMALWLQDVRAEAVRTWLSHPAAQAWLRYDGFADGGDGARKQGWLRTHAGEREPWQRDWRTGQHDEHDEHDEHDVHDVHDVHDGSTIAEGDAR